MKEIFHVEFPVLTHARDIIFRDAGTKIKTLSKMEVCEENSVRLTRLKGGQPHRSGYSIVSHCPGECFLLASTS